MFPEEEPLPGFERPRLVVSRCLDLEPCRYNGAVVATPLIRRLEPLVELVPVCPEVEIGLGVPRDPIRLVRRAGRTALVQPTTGLDLSGAMAGFADAFLDALPGVDGFLLKARSPSCGIHGVKVFTGERADSPSAREAGMFARAVLERFPHHPAEHEARLANPRLRDHFLVRLFALADARRTAEAGSAEALRDLHERYRLTRGTFDPEIRAELERIARSFASGLVADGMGDAYRAALAVGLAPAPREADHLRLIERVIGELAVDADDRRVLRDAAAAYAGGVLPRLAVLERLRAACVRAGRHDLALNPYLLPYPPELGHA
jgi:uncharacterized protein YbbK (DUF523 family)/uncharacterized protein YbgA (DUF1722 family)